MFQLTTARGTDRDATTDREDELFHEHRQAIFRNTDQLFGKLMIFQWMVCIVLALMMSARTWDGESSQVHIHVWAAIFLGGVITLFPFWMTRVRPGAVMTRHVVAIAQMLMSALLIGLTGGRIETHFHVFGSLVILSFYRDWRILIPATLVVLLDHFIRGIYWPYSVYGVLSASPWRSLEHAAWVVFENVFLVISCLRSVQEMRFIAKRTSALEASEEASRLIFEQAPIGMAVVGLDDRFQQVNATLCEMLDYTEEELVTRTPFDITYAEDCELSRQSARSMLNGTVRSLVEKRYVRKDGQILWAARTACAIRGKDGQPHHFLIMVEDISDRKRGEEALRESQCHLEAALQANQLIMDNSQDVICTLDEPGNFVTVNSACETLWGYTPGELIGRNYMEFVYPGDRARTAEVAAGERATGTPSGDFVNRNVRKDGSVVDVLWSASWSASEKTVFCVAHDVTERARTEKELREAKEEADRANRAKSEFLSRMSHELRTPLNAILGFGQLLERQSPTETQRTRVHHIVSAGRHLLNLINEVLDLSRIEAGNLDLSLEPVPMLDVLQETIELMRPLATNRTIEISVEIAIDDSSYVLADRQRLKQVFLNLLSNAVKYTPVGGKVTLFGDTVGDSAMRILVTDTGEGIPADKLCRLFTPFDRLGAEQSGVEGTGLGLALCQRLMQAMHGSVGVDSTAGKGSTFWIELPRTESPTKLLAAQKSAVPVSGKKGSEQQHTILYIEDNLSNLLLIEELLADQPQYKLITAMQGQIGLDLARQHLPDVILLDLHLPDLPGGEVLSRLQETEATRDIPVVVLSADATSHQIARLKKAGARAYLTKPLSIPDFFSVLEDTIGASRQRENPVAA